MADKKFDLVFNASLEVGQVKAAVASLTKSLESAGAKIPQSMATNLSRMIQSLSTELNKLKGMTDIQLDPKNAKNVGKSYEKIFQTFQQIKAALSDIHRTAGIDPEKFFPSEIASNIAKAAQAVQKYKKAMEAGVKTDEHTKATKDIAEAEKKVKSLNDKLDEAARKRQSSSIVKDQLQETRKKLQAEKDQAEAEDKAAKEAQKAIQDRIKSQERLAQVEEEIAKKKKKQQEAINKAAKANEVKNERESMKQAKGKGTDTKIYRDAVASYTESTAEVQKLQGEIDQLEAEYTQLSQAATVTADEIAAANDRATKAATELTNAQKRLNKNQTDIDAADTKYTAATAEVKTLVPEVQKAEDALNQLIQKKKQLEASFEQSTFNELNQDLKRLGVELPDVERNMEGVERALENLASEAKDKVVQAFNGVETATEEVNQALKQTGQVADDFDGLRQAADHAAQDMENLKNQVLDFFSITNTIQIFKNAIHDAVDTVKELDAAMTETAVVTDFSVGDMWEKLPQYSEEATKLGASIKSLYEATTLYYQQGLNSEQAMGVGIETMKMARIANMDATAATEAMTAALRGFNMEINEMSATRINDVYSELAAITAADTSQIATAMSKTASIAESANMEFETTAALLAQIIETTQEAPETAGTAMKTIIARFTEVKQLFSEGMLTGEDSEGEEIDINKIDAALKTVGISLKDFLTGSKGIDDIFLELASKWDTLDLATQRYIATTAAGSRQQSRFLAMMGNYDRTMELVNAATNSAGASQKQFGKTLESLDAKLQKLKNAWDTFTMGLADNTIVKIGIDILTKLLETINNLTDKMGPLGGLAKMILAIGALKIGQNLFTSLFSISGVLEKTGLRFSSFSTTIVNVFQKMEAASLRASRGIKKQWELSAESISQGISLLGISFGLLAQYFRKIGKEDIAKILEATGQGLVVIAGLLSLINVLARSLDETFFSIWKRLAGIIGPFLPMLGTVAAVLITIGAALKGIFDSSIAGKIKTTQKSIKKLGEEAKKVSEEYNNLKENLTSIEDKTNSLNELTRGTLEWKEAVTQLNNEILQLIETYPELANFIQADNGVLKIDYEKTSLDKFGNEYTVNDILENQLRKQRTIQQQLLTEQVYEKQLEVDQRYNTDIKQLASLLEITNKELLESDKANQINSARKVIDDLSRAIAKNEIDDDAQSIRNWLESTDFQLPKVEFGDSAFNSLRNYGHFLLNQQEAINGLTDATIAAQIALINFGQTTPKAQEIISNLVPEILRDIYDRTSKNLPEYIGADDRIKYAEEHGYRYQVLENAEWGGYTTVNIWKGDTILPSKITDEEIREYLYEGKQPEFDERLTQLASHYDNLTGKQAEIFIDLFTQDTPELSREILSKYGTYSEDDEKYIFNQSERDELAKAMNFDDFDALVAAFGGNFEAFIKILNEIFETGGAESIKVRKNLVKNMTKYSTGAQKDFDVNANLLNLLEAKYKDLDVSGILSDVISKLELTGDEEFASTAYESLRDIMMKAEGAAEMEDALNFFNEIDFNNPIDALDIINNEIKNGTGYSRELAMAMKEVNSSFLSASSQMSTLFNSADFKDIKEDLDDIIEKNGEISAADVLDLTKSYKSLDKILKNNKITANGLAEILEQITNETVKVDELTNTVLAAMSSFESLESIATKSVKFFEDFDLGIDESVIGDNIIEWGDLILENMEKGAVGNSQNFRILDILFPGWDEGIETAEGRIAEMTRLGNLLKGNGQNLRKMWSDIASGKDYRGSDISLSAESQKMGLSVRDTGEEIILEGWEGKNLTSVDLVSWISDAYNVSTEMAEALLTDFKNYSGDLAAELRANDYAAGIEEAYESLRQFGDIKIVDEREIQTISKLLGEDAGIIRDDLKERGAIITNFYDTEGNIKSFKEIETYLNDLSATGSEVGKKWSENFISESLIPWGQYESRIRKTLDFSQLEAELNDLGIIGLNAEKLKEEAFNSIVEGLGQGAQAGSAIIETTLANGDVISITVTPEMSYDEFQQQVVKLTKENEYAAIGEAIANAIKNTPVDITIDENTIIKFQTTITDAAKEASAPITIEVSNPTAVTDAIGQTRRQVVIDVKIGENEVEEQFGSGTSGGELSSSGGMPRRAKGIKNAPREEISLVSEEGPELIQKADGGAYLTGTNGPEIAKIEKGDTVYTAEETEQIFKKHSHNTIPRYVDGKAGAYGSGTAYGGSGGKNAGSKSDNDKEDWENPFDKLYNLVREIDEELRQRERIERRYEKLLESVDLTADKLFDNAVEQLRQLEKEKLLNKELQEARRSQIQQYQQENADLLKYAKVVQNEHGEDVLRIHWDQINLVEDPEQGQRIEDYVSQLEEWMDGLNDIEDELNDIEDRIEEVKEIGKEEYLDLENAIKEAVEFSYQEEIDKLSEINESINDTNTELLNAMTKQLNRIRQQRENERTERELQEKQRQLSYLSQDTSGANDLAIMELQKEIEEGTEDYTDTLIDQKIEELEQQNEDAAVQREQQIQILQAQLDHLIQSGEIWDEVYSLMDEGLDHETGLVRGSRLEELLKKSEGFQGMSKIQQMDWLKELQQQAAQAIVYMRLTNEKLDTSIELNRQNYFGPTTPEPEYNGSGSSGSGGGSSGGRPTGSNNSNQPKGYKMTISAQYGFPGGTYTGSTQQEVRNKASSALESWYNQQIAMYDNIIKVQSGIPHAQQATANKNKVIGDISFLRNLVKTAGIVPTYLHGGLADFTGPAWLDGTKSRPELVLNQRDTQNFIQLKDILASLMTGSHTSTENNGDTIYDIDINVESIGNDYDVEQVANKVKSLINEDARYRNNNAVSLKR